MPIYNTDIADIFDEIADYLEIGTDESPFRVRAYRNAARSVRGLGAELKDLVAQKEDLTKLPGIGKELAAKIVEILQTGSMNSLGMMPPTILFSKTKPSPGSGRSGTTRRWPGWTCAASPCRRRRWSRR